MNYIKISKCDIANGPGVRCVLWISGCTLNCRGCHNPETHDFNAGQPFDEAAYQQIKEILERPFIDGITISGGNPTDLKNVETVCNLVEQIKKDFPTKTIWLYSGHYFEGFEFLFDEVFNGSYAARLIKNCDVVVDGPFVQEQRDITLKFRGSRNQRLVDIKKTLNEKRVVLWEE